MVFDQKNFTFFSIFIFSFQDSEQKKSIFFKYFFYSGSSEPPKKSKVFYETRCIEKVMQAPRQAPRQARRLARKQAGRQAWRPLLIRIPHISVYLHTAWSIKNFFGPIFFVRNLRKKQKKRFILKVRPKNFSSSSKFWILSTKKFFGFQSSFFSRSFENTP